MKRIPLSALLCVVSMCTFGQCQAGKPIVPKLTVNGSVTLHKPADQVTLNLSVLTQAETAEHALSDNNAKMQELIVGLHDAGIVKGEYHTGQFSIQPVYTPYPRNPLPDFVPSIIAYSVTNSLTIKTERLELAGSFIDAAGKAGVNQISNISFGLKDPQIYRTEAIQEATTRALHDATVLADSAKLKIVRILDIKLDQPTVYARPGPNMQHFAKVAESAPFLEAPDVDLSATVSVIFEINSI